MRLVFEASANYWVDDGFSCGTALVVFVSGRLFLEARQPIRRGVAMQLETLI